MLGPVGLRQLVPLLAVARARLAAQRRLRIWAAQRSGRLQRVTKHTDGDTLWLSGIGKVRLIGVDTPEVYRPGRVLRARGVGVRRSAPCRSGSEVRYRLGVEERDRYGRALAYVWLRDGRFLNRLLVARGYAQPLTVPPNVEYADLFVRAARRAREARSWPLGPAGVQRLGSPACSGM